MLLDVQISNEISNDKWYIGQSELVSVDWKNSIEFLYQLYKLKML